MEKTVKTAGLKIFLISFGVLALILFLVVGVPLIVSTVWNMPKDSKKISVDSFQEDFRLNIETDMTIHLLQQEYDDVTTFTLLDDDTLDDYYEALSDSDYDVTKLSDDFLYIEVLNDDHLYYFYICPGSSGDFYHLKGVPFYTPYHLVNEIDQMRRCEALSRFTSEEHQFTTEYDYDDFANYFSRINFSDIEYDESEDAIIYDSVLKYTIRDGIVSTIGV